MNGAEVHCCAGRLCVVVEVYATGWGRCGDCEAMPSCSSVRLEEGQRASLEVFFYYVSVDRVSHKVELNTFGHGSKCRR
jgi:hypothetical protein